MKNLSQLNLPKKLWNKSFLAEENAFHYNKKEARLVTSLALGKRKNEIYVKKE